MPDSQNNQQGSHNTDRELWRKNEGYYYSPSIHVTKQGAIGINVGGTVIVKTVEDWHQSAKSLLGQKHAPSKDQEERVASLFRQWDLPINPDRVTELATELNKEREEYKQEIAAKVKSRVNSLCGGHSHVAISGEELTRLLLADLGWDGDSNGVTLITKTRTQPYDDREAVWLVSFTWMYRRQALFQSFPTTSPTSANPPTKTDKL